MQQRHFRTLLQLPLEFFESARGSKDISGTIEDLFNTLDIPVFCESISVSGAGQVLIIPDVHTTHSKAVFARLQKELLAETYPVPHPIVDSLRVGLQVPAQDLVRKLDALIEEKTQALSTGWNFHCRPCLTMV